MNTTVLQCKIASLAGKLNRYPFRSPTLHNLLVTNYLMSLERRLNYEGQVHRQCGSIYVINTKLIFETVPTAFLLLYKLVRAEPYTSTDVWLNPTSILVYLKDRRRQINQIRAEEGGNRIPYAPTPDRPTGGRTEEKKQEWGR